MSLCLVFAMTESIGFDFSFYEAVGVLLGFLAVLSILFMNRLSSMLTGIAAVVGLLSWLLYASKRQLFDAAINYVVNVSQWLYNYSLTGMGMKEEYARVLVLLLCGAISLTVYVFTFKKFCFPVILTGGAALFVCQWIFGFFESYISFYIFVFSVLLYYLRFVLLRKNASDPGEYPNYGEYTFYMAPVCLAVILIAYAIPAPDKPLEWKWLDNRIVEINNFFSSRQNYVRFEYFDIASSGFGGSGRLGGRVKPDKTVVLSVDSPRRLYLKGSVRDVYTGVSWSMSDRTRKPASELGEDFYYDAMDSMDGMNFLSAANPSASELFSSDAVHIRYENLRTKSIFMPIKTYKALFPSADRSDKLVDPNGMLTADEVLEKGYNYDVESLSIFYGKTEFIELIGNSRRGYYRDLLKAMENFYDVEGSTNKSGMFVRVGSGNSFMLYSYESIEEKALMADEIYAKYLQLPETLPRRVTELAETIASEPGSDYEKAKAIEEHLSASYPYTLDAGRPPRGRDFVDYFLFELKEGYCSYYATAMVVMLRSVGIPSRYVEGYMLPPRPDKENTYKVTNENAHAWVEAYFEGFGWLPFEPTSPFFSSFYQNEEKTASVSESFAGDPYYSDYMEMLEEMNQQGIVYTGDIIPMEEEGDAYLAYKITAGIFSAIILGFVLLALFNFTRNRLALYRTRGMGPRSSILAMSARYFKVLKLQGYGIKPGETPLEYSKRISDYYLYDDTVRHGDSGTGTTKKLKPRFVEIIELFMLSKYSTAQIPESGKKIVMDYDNYLMGKTKKELGALRYIMYRYLLGSF